MLAASGAAEAEGIAVAIAAVEVGGLFGAPHVIVHSLFAASSFSCGWEAQPSAPLLSDTLRFPGGTRTQRGAAPTPTPSTSTSHVSGAAGTNSADCGPESQSCDPSRRRRS